MYDAETPNDSETIVVTTSRPAPSKLRQSAAKHLPRYAVVVLNDELHTFRYVRMAMVKVFGTSERRGQEIAIEIDSTGRAIVWTGSLEVAELKRDQLVGLGPDFFGEKPVTFPLGVEIEPVD